MRRYARTVAIVVVLVVLAGLILGFQRIQIGGFERGGDTVLGLSLGLDLQGGSYLVYEAEEIDPVTGEGRVPSPDEMAALKRAIERRVNASGLGLPIIQILGENRLLIQLPGISDIERAESIIGETARLVFLHREYGVTRDLTELEDDDILSIEADYIPAELLEAAQLPSSEPLPAFPEVMTATSTEATATSTATTTPEDLPPVLVVDFTSGGAGKFSAVVDRLKDDFNESMKRAETGEFLAPSRLDVSIEGETPLRFDISGIAIARVGSSTRFVLPFPQGAQGEQVTDLEVAREMVGDDSTVRFSEIQTQVDTSINLTGDDLARAYPSQQSQSGAPIVVLEFKERGAKIFGDLTSRIAGSPTDAIAIFLDDEELISPTVSSAITSGAAIIQGRDFTVERVRDVALLLEAGRLPIPINQVEKRTVDAILGADSLRKSVIAGMVGLGLVLLFMVLYYRVPGAAAAVALVIYAAPHSGHLQDHSHHPGPLGGIRGDPLRRHGGGREHPDLRAHEGRAAGGANTDVLGEHRLQPRMAGDPGQQRIDPDHLRHPVLVCRPAWSEPGTELLRRPGRRRRHQHVLGHRHNPHPAEGDSQHQPGGKGPPIRARRRGPAPAARCRSGGLEELALGLRSKKGMVLPAFAVGHRPRRRLPGPLPSRAWYRLLWGLRDEAQVPGACGAGRPAD